MSGASKKLMGTTAAGGGSLAIEDVFSTYLYAPATSNSQVSVVNGIDLTGNDGMVWIKRRDGEALNHALVDTLRGGNKVLHPNLDADQYTASIVSNFSSDGFTTGTSSFVSTAPENFASWTFRKAPRFFDCVEYTGTGSTQSVSHSLGVTPGMIIVKRTDSSGDWAVAARVNDTQYTVGDGSTPLSLNTTSGGGSFYTTAPLINDSTFNTGAFWTASNLNASGGTYVAYLFAHDPLGPSGDGSDGLIACGSFTTDGSGNATVDLGWEPQFALIKKSSDTGVWIMLDSMRGWVNGSSDNWLRANGSDAETFSPLGNPTATGFETVNLSASQTFIYIAIRRGPMRAPESGTEVFAVDNGDGSSVPSFTSGFPVDFGMLRDVGADGFHTSSRLTSGKTLDTNSTAAEGSNSNYRFDYQSGWFGYALSSNYYSWMFRRAPGFFDVVAYSGNSTSGRTVPHNLGVAPELMVVKRRSSGASWTVYVSALGATQYLRLQNTNAAASGTGFWNDTAPTDTVFTVGNDADVNGSGENYISYHFATLPGVSKVGSYTGNGTSQTINCGFTTGARFILIKRTDSTGDWYVWDTARGIVTGNDPFLELNTTDAEVTSDDSIDPDSSGFIVNQTATTNVNVSSASYIFYAIA